MVENEYKRLIDRDKQIVYVQTRYAGILGVLRDMVNYGSNLIPRCFVSSNRRLEDAIILGVLLRQAVAMFDAIEILVSNAAVYPCYLQTRAIFEASLYIQWILQTDTEKRAKYYYVSNLRKERVWANRTQRGSPDYLAFQKDMEKLGIIVPDTANRLGAEGQKYLQEINRILEKPSLAAIDKEFDSYREKRRLRYDPPWYAPLEIQSVRQLAKNLQRLHEYELIYVESSEVMHSTSLEHHINFSQGPMKLIPIRYHEGIDMVLWFSMVPMLKIYLDVLAYYRPDERPNFSRKYFEDWRQEFIGILEDEYKNDNSTCIVI